MTLKSYVILVLLATILCISSFIFVVINIDPNEAALLGFLLFYMSFFCSVLGGVSLMGLGLRVVLTKEEPVFKLVIISFRQAILIASVFTIAIFLQSQNVLNVLNIGLLVFGFMCIELFLSKMQKR